MSLQAENPVELEQKTKNKTRVDSVHSQCCVWKESTAYFHNKLTDTRYASGFHAPRKKAHKKVVYTVLTQNMDGEITVGRSLLVISKNSGR